MAISLLKWSTNISYRHSESNMEETKHIVISLGGSLIVPDEIDVAFIKDFVDTIREYVSRGFLFVIITGGGKICRKYNKSVEEIVSPTKDDLDWIGIAATRLNAEFVRVLFGDLAYHRVILDPDTMQGIYSPVIVGGGWKPGNSSDLAAVHAAATLSAKKVVNLSNIDYAYDKDPKKFPDAVKIEKTSWPDFRKFLPKEWEPGLNSPFDPLAAEHAESIGLEVAIMNGKNIENFKKYLDGEEFLGTIIK
jgi:uridylate kinase